MGNAARRNIALQQSNGPVGDGNVPPYAACGRGAQLRVDVIRPR
jgi:hypothetical protein